ncbi:MAG: YebC/PmpR family DNA-binding transcriptional regulator [Candidatus Dependentiae bacterium]
MSGHNKWSQIKHKKAKEDAKRGQAFTKLIKEITIAARSGGGDPAGNPKLRLLLEKAKDINMPIDNAQRAIKRGTGELPGVQYEAITYEGYGPGGIAIMVDTLTDNKNRTVAELRHMFSHKGGTLAETGAVGWMFDRQGVIKVTGKATEDQLLEWLIDFNINDVQTDETGMYVFCDPKSVETVRQALATHPEVKVESAEIEWVAKNTMNISEDNASKAYDLLSELQDHEDVQNVFTNLA